MAQFQQLITRSPEDGWVLLTDSDVTEFSFQVLGGEWELLGVVGVAQPDNEDNQIRGWAYKEGDGVLDAAVDRLFRLPNASRIYGRAVAFQSSILVDHA